jgi:hypothetical protein
MVLRLEYHHKLRICKDTTCIEIEKEEIKELVRLIKTVARELREEFAEERWFTEEETEEEETPLARLFKF